MYFNFRAFFRMAYLSFFKWRSTTTRLTPKRIFFLLGFFLTFPLVQLFNATCFLLDEIFFPGYRSIEFENPLFIVGNHRSGTTFLYRLMAKDEDQFFCFRTWEIMFPAIIQKKALSFIGRMDRRMGRKLSNGIRRWEARLLHKTNKMHKASLFDPEEDENLLVHSFSGFSLIFFFPFGDWSWVERFDQTVNPRDRRRMMNFYRNCVKRQAFFSGNGKHFLSKNPVFTSRIDSLMEYFPGCKIIYLARNPLDAIPSMINAIHELWHSVLNFEAGYPLQDRVYELAKYNYTYPLGRLDLASPDSYVTVNYEDLKRKPSRVIQTICEKFGYALNPKFLHILEVQDEKTRNFRSRHLYSIDRCRITREQIISDLPDLFDRFGFDTSK